MSEPAWILTEVVLAIHSEQLSEHGGLEGIRDQAMLESALSRPRNQYAYEDTDLFDLAAAYAYGLVRNHPFLDGNKRTSLVTARTFLLLNGWDVPSRQGEKVALWDQMAEGNRSEAECAEWLRVNSVPFP